MKSTRLEEFYAKFPTMAAAASNTEPTISKPREVGHFNIFTMEDLMRSYPNRPAMSFQRQDYYKLCLMNGRSQTEYADKVVEVKHQALWFATSRVPYRWLPHDLNQTGYFCLFTEDFMLPSRSSVTLEELPIFQPGSFPILEVSTEDYSAIEAIFKKMAQEITSTYAYKYDLLRIYLWELIHWGQKLQPVPAEAPAHNASARVTALFGELLERQFPLATSQQQLRLRTAKDYADQLAVHVNHLNRVLKETTGHTTTELIGGRMALEAKLLLKQTTWTVSEIADSLGFADVAHFCNFFKRQTTLTPGDFRG
ncbi:helix-turn-helix transcriptional regulator [Hymenobacter sp. BT186]|uniref:Helix-turn-helix transcriptional regulator n=1 Tax=Hymenobacter telluris TaxID=2816474 RepID=A0A939F0U6_9BACT|nr:helix-turn-helix transcriptional regulator [Hymenobacter telluris]MBO0359378.1 helix-turn-helix transcriptional regulator [Hymenobacter telluris]MBW3375404.1 helix-turn-helix transcriptional regulator [Hymenobacter norwichensis]